MNQITMEKKIERFFKRIVKTDGCWLWSGAKYGDGYGRYKIDDEERAHRVSYVLHNGKIPFGMYVLHKCDNRECTNPDHLFLGTQEQNIKDMIEKKRDNFSGDGSKTISEDEKVLIASEYESGKSVNYLKEKYSRAWITVKNVLVEKGVYNVPA